VNKHGKEVFHGSTKGVPRQEQVGQQAVSFLNEWPFQKASVVSAHPFRCYSQAFPRFLENVPELAETDRFLMIVQMKQAVITGGNGTLGSAIAAALEGPGWKVLTPSSTELDVRDQTSIQRFFQQNPTELLICAAGIVRDVPLLRMTGDSWDDVFAVNFKGAAACAKAVLPEMIRNCVGQIIFISSFSALHPPVGQAAYATAKAALLGLTRDIALAHGRQNIRVNAVLPGFIESRMTENVTDQRRDEVRDSHLLHRFNTPAEVGKFIRHLHHDLPHTSGQVFQLDSRIS